MSLAYDLTMKGPVGLYNRYFRTEKYCKKWLDSGRDIHSLENRIKKDRDVIRGITLPVAGVLIANSYRVSNKDKIQKILGHFSKGYATSEFGQMAADGLVKNKFLKYLSGLGLGFGGSLATETLQRKDILPGVFDEFDIMMEMFGAYFATTLERFFDVRLNNVLDAQQKEK
jgi:hypothetical protein